MIAYALALAGLAAARAAYPRMVEWRAARLRAVDAHGIVRGAGRIVLERDGAPGVLVLHGAGDTTQVVAALAEHLHAQGFAVHAPLLAAHGRSLRSLRTANAAAWYDEVEHAYDELELRQRRVAVVGLSMGGALAIRLAARRKGMCALVLLAPYVGMPTLMRRAARSTAWWGTLLPYFPSGGRRSIHDPAAAAATLGYHVFTPAALRALSEVVDAADESLPLVTTPTLVMQSLEDNRIAAPIAQRAFERLGAREKEIVWTTGAGHVITVDYGHAGVFEATTRWLVAHCGVENTKGGRSSTQAISRP